METLIDAIKEAGLEVNTEKTKYMLLSRHQNAKSWHKDSWQMFWKSGKVQIFGNDYNKSKPDSGGN
jgi:adenine-specific DNA methylase